MKQGHKHENIAIKTIHAVNDVDSGQPETQSQSDALELPSCRHSDRLPSGLRALPQFVGGFVATDSSSPLTALLLVFVGEIGLRRADKGAQLLLVFASHILEGENSSRLLVHDGAETCLALDDHVRDTHLPAESGQEDDEFDRVNVIGNDNKRRLLGFDERYTVVETVFDEMRLLGVFRLGFLFLGRSLSNSIKAGLLLLFCFRAVLVQEFEQLSGGVLIQSVRELCDCRRDLETLVENDLLTLKADVFRPFHEASQVSLGLDVLADTEVFGGRLEERVFCRLGRFGGSERSGRWLLSLGRLVIETRKC